ncbi:hypothetical protein EVAR_102752_1 [Eumeta japonica]|uniref:Uncharacterized protein n=1 Tax=Eumeta variegata TaxID=151549 RepID=A0A4C1THW1_EUMVA|nr:hypothetical protein EVAR_102752_1 [Eumeta japonica]
MDGGIVCSLMAGLLVCTGLCYKKYDQLSACRRAHAYDAYTYEHQRMMVHGFDRTPNISVLDIFDVGGDNEKRRHIYPTFHLSLYEIHVSGIAALNGHRQILEKVRPENEDLSFTRRIFVYEKIVCHYGDRVAETSTLEIGSHTSRAQSLRSGNTVTVKPTPLGVLAAALSAPPPGRAVVGRPLGRS